MNPHEVIAQIRKSEAIADVLDGELAAWTDEAVEALRECDEPLRHYLARTAQVPPPSDAAWAMTIEAVLRRRSTRDRLREQVSS